MMLRILVADDERIARDIIKLLLERHPESFDIVEAGDGNQALAMIAGHKPHIVFLDVQMPGHTGVELAAQLPAETAVIFITAYDRYAVNAFELQALDYLLKPFEDERFYGALDKAMRKVADSRVSDYQAIGPLIQQLSGERHQEYKSTLVVKETGRIRLVKVDQIKYIAGAGNYAEIHLFDDKTLLHRETLSTLEKQLDPDRFIRIHRSTIVRHSQINELRPNVKGDYTVQLKSGEFLTLSRRFKVKLGEILG